MYTPVLILLGLLFVILVRDELCSDYGPWEL